MNTKKTMDDTPGGSSGFTADQNRMPIVEALQQYRASGRMSLHMPGHKGASQSHRLDGLEQLIARDTLRCDITEIASMDDFHAPEGIIRDAECLAADLYGADRTFFLVNGTTSGMMAAVAAVASDGEAILIAGDCHKSVIRGLQLSGARPVYLNPCLDPETGLAAGLDPHAVKEAFAKNPGVKGIVLPHPTYYGTFSDLRTIAEIAHEAGGVVIADEAHGAQIPFLEKQGLLTDALSAGADVTVQSTHKMIGSLTQSAMLHVQGDRVDRETLEFYIKFMHSTSPSYLLLGSLDAVRHSMAAEGRAVWKSAVDLTTRTKQRMQAIPGIHVVNFFHDASGEEHPLEPCRILFRGETRGLTPGQLAAILSREYGIDLEFADDVYCLALVGANTSEACMDALVQALQEIMQEHATAELLSTGENPAAGLPEKDVTGRPLRLPGLWNRTRPDAPMTPREAVQAPRMILPLKDCPGMIAAQSVAVYPPGIPCICPGEQYTEEICDFLNAELEKGTHIHGLTWRMENGERVPSAVLAEDGSREMLFRCLF